MIFSQLLLAGFVAYWLSSQYEDQKDLLRDDLSRMYDESRNQVIDSLLFNWVVEPALKDSVRITMTSNIDGDTTIHVQRNPGKMGGIFRAEPLGNTMMAFSIKDSANGNEGNPARTIGIMGKDQDMLIRSVKLIINHTGDSTRTEDAMPVIFARKPDTALFMEVFARKLADKNFGVYVAWSHDTLKRPENLQGPTNFHFQRKFMKEKGSGLLFKSVFPDGLPSARVTREFPYLITQIIPQILFALILLLLTGSAFFFTNRSLKRQLILNDLRNDFVSNITHELKTPVSTVKVAIEALKTFDKVSNPAKTLEYLDMAGQEMNRLDQLISQVLDQSLIGEQNQVLQPVPSNIKNLIDNILLALQPKLSTRNATLRFEPVELTGTVMVDPLHFQGVLTNLIDNSLKYGSENPEILLKLWPENGYACIEVSDNGPGIPKEYLGRVFDKFFRVPNGDRHNIKGYGLGLSFAALVMEQHHGSISVKNNETAGCTFTLKFPAAKP